MKFTFRICWRGRQEPFLAPMTHDIPSAEKAREIARELSSRESMRSADIEIISDDGTIKERWHDRISGRTLTNA
jgi:hypothetical protein